MKQDKEAKSLFYKKIIGCVALLLCLPLLFYGLDHYALWDDEAMTALLARGILKTGDTSAFIDHNIIAYRNGILLSNGFDRSTPPLPSYVTAMAMHLFGNDAWVCRLPFAFFGFLTYALIFYWLWEEKFDQTFWLIVAVAIVGNVSLFLFFRQCRYYSPAIFFSVLAAYWYLKLLAEGKRRQLWMLALCLTFLLTAGTLNYAALVMALIVDYVFWGRKGKVMGKKQMYLPVVAHVAFALIFLSVWNPLKTGNADPILVNSIQDRIKLMWFIVRDINRCEFFPGLFLTLAPIFAFLRKDVWLLRGGMAFIIYLVTICVFSPQNLQGASFADVRYLVPVIPLLMFLTARLLWILFGNKILLVTALSILLFWTNLFNEMGLGYAGLRSTLLAYGVELASPPPESYTPAVNWIKAQVKPKESVLVIPLWKTYPLMYHAPHPVYAWQLSDPPKRAYAHVDPIHIQGRKMPDYVVAFGPIIQDFFRSPLGKDYQLMEILPYYWRDMYRPELFWRSFRPVKYDRNAWQEVYILKRKS